MPLVNRKQVAVSLPPEIADWAKKQAEKECRPFGRYIENLIRKDMEAKSDETQKHDR